MDWDGLDGLELTLEELLLVAVAVTVLLLGLPTELSELAVATVLLAHWSWVAVATGSCLLLMGSPDRPITTTRLSHTAQCDSPAQLSSAQLGYMECIAPAPLLHSLTKAPAMG